MRLRQQILTRDTLCDRSGVFRLKALFSEQRARESIDPTSKQDWEELAIEWHTIANLSARLNSEATQIEVS